MRRYFYVDTENLGYAYWSKHLSDLTKNDTVIFMISEKTSGVPLYFALTEIGKLLNSCTVKTISCHNGTPNAMDFCLVTTLGRFIERAPKSKHIILSEDTGYDAVIHMLTEDGFIICRYGKEDNVIPISIQKIKLEDMPEDFKSKWNKKKEVLLKQYSNMPQADCSRKINEAYVSMYDNYIATRTGD